MFKVESYVTPFIVSYVDKYVKNIKPEDSRVSLWGGDAVFHNLDLRLDVLEEELHSPFTFSSGHIHELRIHVPWTKLASEPIVITINTIECTLKLKSHEDRLSQRSGQCQQKSRGKKQEVVASPPGYIQSLLSKIVNNISIVCNNVILKYLEEDIVLSLNARTVAITSVDSKWEPSFIELAAPDLTLRKQITVTDLTICLDQCNSVGKIPVYQEPLLYRSSFKIRMSSIYPNVKGIRASHVRIDWMFTKLDFSLSDQQIPMFMRLFNLVLALYLGEFKVGASTEGEQGDDASVAPADGEVPEENPNSQSWAGWAWSYVPSILPVYPEDENADGKDVPSERERVVNLGVYIERVNWTIKWTERDGPLSSGTKRVRFIPFLTARMQGCFLEVTLGGVEWVDVQGGISHLTLEPSSTNCLCGAPEEVSLYYLQGCERAAFLNSSLYDPDSESDAKVSDSMFHWDRHINRVTEATLLERTPALAFDYVYQLELPQENASEYLSQLGSELEYSNLYERALFRLAVGPFQLKISYGLCHRLSAVQYASGQYNYPDYVNSSQHAYHRQRSTQEASVNQLLAMAGNLPKRTYQVAILRPLVFVSLSPIHPPFDIERLVEKRIIRQRVVEPPTRSPPVPVLKISCTCADFRLARPMYPLRLTFTLQAAQSVPAALAQQNHSEMRLKLHDLAAELVTEECSIALLRPSSATLLVQSILLPELWTNNAQQVLTKLTLETESMDWSFTRAQFDYVSAMWRSLSNPADPLLAIPPNSLGTACLRVEEHARIQFTFRSIRFNYSDTFALYCLGGRIGSLTLSIARPDAEPQTIFTSVTSSDGRPYIDSLLQIPRSLITQDDDYVDSKGVPVAFLKLGTFSGALHPDLFKWFDSSSGTCQEDTEAGRAEDKRGQSVDRVTSHASNQSVCARDSGLSSSFEGQTWREAPSSVVLSHSTPTKRSPPSKQSGDRSLNWIAYRKLLQRSLLHVDILRGELVTYGKSGGQEALLRFQLPSVYVSCPHLPTDTLTIDDLPFRPPETASSSFPWTVNFQDFSMTSKSGAILEPVSLKMTIALNPSSMKTEGNRQGQTPNIDLCIHIDMNAVQVKLTDQQVSLVSNQAADLFQWLGTLSSASSSPTGPETHFELGLWLQWAMPRFLLSLETAEARSVLDMEDVTTSVDYQHRRFAKIKSRLTSICAKLFVAERDHWALDPGTNGIILSCSDDITRDLWTQLDVVPPRVETVTPSDVGADQGDVPAGSDGAPENYPGHQEPKSLPKVANSGTGGVMTVTWTRAQRKDVYSKWSGNASRTRSNSQTEEQSATDDSTTQGDAYLQEMDVGLEAIDLVLTEKLLEHLNRLTSSIQPAIDRAFNNAPSVSSVNLPISSHSMPLMFATSKGFRLFLVDDRFILLNVDRIELSPRIQNPIDRCTVLRPDLFADAEQSGSINIPGNDVEDRQYQLDLTGFSISSGDWNEIAKLSWIRRTMNPASVLHTMVENPALEWNARNQASEEALVAVTPIVARASLKTVYAPPIVSVEQQCLVAGQAVEISAASDIRLFVNLGQLEHFDRWIALLTKPGQSEADDAPSHPSHAFITCNKISLVFYELLSGESASFVPLASVLLVQPHILMKSINERQETTLEWSVYDARLQLPCWAGEAPVSSAALPDEAQFPISLIKTLSGEASAETGIPPSLLTIRQTSTRQLSLDVGRPVKLFVHHDVVRLAQFLARRLAAMKRSGSTASEPSDAHSDEISIKTSQILVELPLEAGVLTAGWNEVSLDVAHWNSARFVASAICVQVAGSADELHQMCDPFSAECRVRLVPAAWNDPEARLVRVSCQADNLRIHAGLNQIRVVSCLVQLINDGFYSAGFPSNDPSPGTRREGEQGQAPEKDRQFLDDLRTGAFDFQVHDVTQHSGCATPKPYQVVFNVQPPSMTWTYPQPRALTRVEIYPIPLLKADDSGTGSEQVDCSLEYWDDCAEQYRILRKFSLSETRFTRVPLPAINEARAVDGLCQDEPVFSHVWRIVMNFSEDNVPEQRPKKIIAAPPSLVACTKVDSYFSPALVPTLQVHCTFNHVSLSLHYQARESASRATNEEGFRFDGAVPGDFPFATLSLSSTSIALRNCRSTTDGAGDKKWLELSTHAQVNVTDFESLVDEPLVEPIALDLKVASEGDERVSIHLTNRESFDINLSQRTVRTLTTCLTGWDADAADLERGPLFTDYVVRNDTQQVLRIGQFGTGESVLLASRAAHQYAWKLIGNENKKLHACMEGSRWRWCQPIRLDKVGTFIRSVADSRPSMPLVWTVRPLGPVQKEVTVRGQVQVGNLFQFALEVKLVPVSSAGTNVVLPEVRAVVPADSLAPSFVFPLEHLQAVKVRFPGSAWSGSIPLVQHSNDNKPRNVLLVRIVPKDKDDVLNLWCHLLTEKVDQQHSRLLVILSPLYVVRSYLPLPLRLHLRTPGLSLSHYCEIEGRGQLSVLQSPGTVDHSHMISFQLSSDLPESTPAVPLSWTMVSQYSNHASSQQPDSGSNSQPFIAELIDDLFSKQQVQRELPWPFTGDEIEVSASEPPQLKTDVRVAFSTLHRRCHTLLVELKPWALLVNRSGVDLLVKRNDEASWLLPSGATAAPPPLSDGTFRFGLKTSDDGPVFYSQPLLLQDSDHYHFMSYRPRVDGAIPMEGHCFVRVPINDDKIAFLTVSSKSHDGMRILIVEPTIRLRNELNCQLDVGSFVGGKEPVRFDNVTWNATRTRGATTALVVWGVSSANHAGFDYPHLYVSTRLCSHWSCPIRLAHPGARQPTNTVNPQRHCISVPLSPKCAGTSEAPADCPLTLYRFEQNGCVYLTVGYDSSPSLVIINRTSHSLLYAQASDNDPGTAEEDCEGFLSHGIVRPDAVAFYTPPWNQQRYIDASPPNSLPRLSFALPPEGDAIPVWSQAVHPSHAYDQFLNVGSQLDIMVRIEHSGTANQTTVYLESVTNHQISASDIRGRIAPSSDSLEKEPSPSNNQIQMENIERHDECADEASDVVCGPFHIHAAGLVPAQIKTSTCHLLKRVGVFLYWPEVSVCLRDDTASPRREVARLTLDHLLIETQPCEEVKQDVSIYIGHVQLDNQLCRLANKDTSEDAADYDFPVVLCAQNSPAWTPQDFNLIREKAMINLHLSFAPGSLSAVRLRVEPVFVFIEDRFLAVVGDYLQSVMASASQSEARNSNRDTSVPFPEKILDVMSTASSLVNLDRLLVDTVDLDLSLRSSLKLYIALDHSPLRLSLFERTHISTTPYKLGQSLAMHYLSSALFKAGWVVGSLELLGSPTALARTVTIGLKDFVRLPYQGIWRGPRGFLAGILNGSASLVSHVTAGTVTSVTQLASSVARNVDRLSFDSDFQQRSEEGRRKKPQGLVQGISWGMGALGLSLLGALGGLAHHPLQSIMEEGTVSPRNLAVGLTKGIVGVVAKPISGAADLVAQTGQGLLSATQWREPFQMRRPQGPLSGGLINSSLEMICSGSAKILWKITDEAPTMSFSGRGQDARANRICCCMEAMRARVNEALPIREQLAPVLLVISTQNFCVLNAEDGEVQVVLDLNEVDCWAHESDPTLILVRPTPLSLSSAFAEARRDEDISPTFDYERVSEFVRVTTPFFLPESSRSPDKGKCAPLQSSSNSSSLVTMEFFINPAWKAFFIQCFKLAKRQRKGLGFTLL